MDVRRVVARQAAGGQIGLPAAWPLRPWAIALGGAALAVASLALVAMALWVRLGGELSCPLPVRERCAQ